MKFKTEKILNEFRLLPARLRHILYYADGVSRSLTPSKEVVVTCLLRTRAEQESLYEWAVRSGIYDGFDSVPNSVHQYWRGADIRIWIYKDWETEFLVESINKYFKYGRGNLNTAVLKKDHIHLQVKNFE